MSLSEIITQSRHKALKNTTTLQSHDSTKSKLAIPYVHCKHLFMIEYQKGKTQWKTRSTRFQLRFCLSAELLEKHCI